MPSLAVDVSKNNAGRLAAIWDDIVSRATEKSAEAMAATVHQSIEDQHLIKTGRMLASVNTSRIDRAKWSVVVSAVSDKGFPYPALLDRGGRFVKAYNFFTGPKLLAEDAYPKAVFGEIRNALA